MECSCEYTEYMDSGQATVGGPPVLFLDGEPTASNCKGNRFTTLLTSVLKVIGIL